jgi:hypothetical protein
MISALIKTKLFDAFIKTIMQPIYRLVSFGSCERIPVVRVRYDYYGGIYDTYYNCIFTKISSDEYLIDFQDCAFMSFVSIGSCEHAKIILKNDYDFEGTVNYYTTNIDDHGTYICTVHATGYMILYSDQHIIFN